MMYNFTNAFVSIYSSGKVALSTNAKHLKPGKLESFGRGIQSIPGYNCLEYSINGTELTVWFD